LVYLFDDFSHCTFRRISSFINSGTVAPCDPPFTPSSTDLDHGWLFIRYQTPTAGGVAPCPAALTTCNPIQLSRVNGGIHYCASAGSGAQFDLDCVFNGEGGIIVRDLPAGQYFLQVIQSPPGYLAPEQGGGPAAGPSFSVNGGRPQVQMCTLVPASPGATPSSDPCQPVPQGAGL
jgi:hypothetical protein